MLLYDFKFWLAVIATLIATFGYIPYLRDIFAHKTKPHLFTWIIWAITQGTAAVALLYGGGKFGGMSLVFGTILILAVAILSLKYGTKHITKTDILTLVAALLAIVVWWQLDNPLLSVFLVSIIDGLGYIPTFRKTYAEPYSETVLFWILMFTVSILTILANAEYNFLTVTYSATLALANITVALICITRRKRVK